MTTKVSTPSSENRAIEKPALTGYVVRRRLLLGANYGCLLLLAFVFIFPTLFMFVSSFKTERQLFLDLQSVVYALIPRDATLENYEALFDRVPFWRFMATSFLVTVLTVVVGLFINSMLAYSLARLRWRGKKLLLTAVIALIIVPLEAISVPLLVVVNELPWMQVSDGGLELIYGWLDSYHVQIIPFIANAFYIFLFYQFFINIPRDFDEAAIVDGASPFGIYRRIIVPLSRPVFATVAILQALTTWSAYLWPLMTVRSPEFTPLTIGIGGLFINDRVPWGPILAFAALATLPLMLMYLSFQRWFIQSVASSGVKG